MDREYRRIYKINLLYQMEKSLIFQHLCTETTWRNDNIFLMGRTMDGRSVCVEIHDINPHFCLKIEDPKMDINSFL